MKNKNNNKNNFCIRPFNSGVIVTNGDIKICCQITPELTEFKEYVDYNIKNNTVEEWLNSNYIKYVRKNILENKKLKECVNCWKKEDKNLISHRNESNFEYKSIFQNKFEKHLKLLKKDNLFFPEDIELQITNSCNLKCQMCAGKYSSTLLIENNALGFESLKQKDYNLNNSEYLKIENIIKHDLSLLNLRGGEPLFNKKIIDLLSQLVKNGKAKNITLHITTNGTICNNKILNLLKNFKKIRLMFSIEGTEKCNEYIRFPSTWSKIKNNVDQFKKLNNVYIYVNTVVQNLNILYMRDLISYCYENNFFINLSKLEEPEQLDMLNLPKKLLEKAYQNLLKVEKETLIHTSNFEEILTILKNKLKNFVPDEIKYQEFISMIKKRDSYRRVHIKNYMPDLAEEIYK